MRFARPIAIGAVLTLSTLGTLMVVRAQGGPNPTKLHEDLVPPAEQAERTAKRIADGVPVIGPSPSARQNPTAIASQDRLLPEPSLDEAPSKEEPVHGTNSFGAVRQNEAKLDYATTADSTLHYVEVFNPSILPFKRMSALDAVSEDYTLVPSSRALADLPVGGEPSSGHDLFWGDLAVELKPGLDIAIPSVSPDMRILSYESEPKVDLIFSKDAADNYYLRTEESGAGGTYRVIFLAEAKQSYFAPRLPPRTRVRDIPSTYLRPLPSAVQKRADEALSTLRLHDGMYLNEVLDKLVFYFRGFDAQSPPPNSGDIYWDLFKSKAGVCRHRSFAFMVTANAVGIPARYITNEAHAFVEVWVPGSEWIRIDLGGAASTLEVSNASDKSMYKPRGEDPFSSPDSYSENYTRLEGDIQGLRDDQIRDRQEVYDDPNAENGSFFGDEQDPDFAPDDDDELTGPGSDLPPIPEEKLQGRAPTRVEISFDYPDPAASPGDPSATVGYRGESIAVRGLLVDDKGAGIANAPINIYLAPAGNEGNGSIRVGRTATDAVGEFYDTIEIPASMDLASYELIATYPGSPQYRPVNSEY